MKTHLKLLKFHKSLPPAAVHDFPSKHPQFLFTRRNLGPYCGIATLGFCHGYSLSICHGSTRRRHLSREFSTVSSFFSLEILDSSTPFELNPLSNLLHHQDQLLKSTVSLPLVLIWWQSDIKSYKSKRIALNALYSNQLQLNMKRKNIQLEQKTSNKP